MSARSSIVSALVEKLKEIDGTGTNQSNLFNNVYAKLKFWDEINDFPSVYIVPGSEIREYLPGDFKWGFLNVSLKVYVKAENAAEELEKVLEDIEKKIDANRVLLYEGSKYTTEILVTSIVTDEGLLVPYGVGEINLQVRYQVL